MAYKLKDIQKLLNDESYKRPIDEIAHEAGISRQAIYYIISGKHKPTFTTVQKVCKALGVDYLEEV